MLTLEDRRDRRPGVASTISAAQATPNDSSVSSPVVDPPYKNVMGKEQASEPCTGGTWPMVGMLTVIGLVAVFVAADVLLVRRAP